MVDAIVALDKKIFLLVTRYTHTRFLDILMPVITRFKFWWVPAILFLLYLVVWGGKKGRIVAGLTLLIFVLTDQLSSSVLKPLFSRPRPFVEFSYLKPLVEVSPKYSFPSTHATNIFAVATLISHYYRKFLSVALFIAFLISFSRVYVMVHYPLDVIFGAVVGVACAFLVIWSEKLVSKKLGKNWVLDSLEGNTGTKDEDSIKPDIQEESFENV